MTKDDVRLNELNWLDNFVLIFDNLYFVIHESTWGYVPTIVFEHGQIIKPIHILGTIKATIKDAKKTCETYLAIALKTKVTPLGNYKRLMWIPSATTHITMPFTFLSFRIDLDEKTKKYGLSFIHGDCIFKYGEATLELDECRMLAKKVYEDFLTTHIRRDYENDKS